MRTIDEVTKEFGEIYSEVKEKDTTKKKLQTEFFQIATAELEKRTLARKVVTMPEGTVTHKGDWERWVDTFHPGWRFVEFKDDSAYDMIIEEDPKLLPYTYVNQEDGIVYGRTTSSGSPQLDDERLRQEDLDLWTAITDWPEPWLSLVTDAFKSLNINHPEQQAQIFLEAKGVQRVLKPIETLSDDQLQDLQEYLVPSPIAVRLVPPRPAKEDELT